MTLYASKSDGMGGVVCGCEPMIACAGNLFPFTFVLTQSGIDSCGCIAEGSPTPIDYAELQNFMCPASFTLTYDGSTYWLSGSGGSADLMTGPDCASLTLYQSGTFSANAQCSGGFLQVGIQFDYDNFGSQASILVYEGLFAAPGTSQPNLLDCVNPGTFAGGGTGSI